MIEKTGNMWDHKADAYIITTNGTVKKNGSCVMGRGCAKEAADRWPDLPLLLGKSLSERGNRVFTFHPPEGFLLITYPVKHNWWEKADMDLIIYASHHLRELADREKLSVVVMPQPGCGNGGLDWKDVKPKIESKLDERFIVFSYD